MITLGRSGGRPTLSPDDTMSNRPQLMLLGKMGFLSGKDGMEIGTGLFPSAELWAENVSKVGNSSEIIGYDAILNTLKVLKFGGGTR